jgi:hypothetical protein
MNRALCLVSVSAVALLLSACAVSRAIEAPPEKNFTVLEPGTHRDLVRAEFGKSAASADGTNCDVFSFSQGSTDWKYLRAVGYGLADLGTLGVAEVVVSPAEAAVGKDKVQVRVCYDGDWRVVYSERLEPDSPDVVLTGARPGEAKGN